MASLSAAVARAGPSARAVYERTVRDLMEELFRGMPAAPDQKRRALAARIAEACRANVAEQLGVAGRSR
jgi:hypothetical protein